MARNCLDSLGTLQRAVMEILWEVEEATVREVLERLAASRPKPPAYTTVLTVMQKLDKAGWLTHRTEGQTYVYAPVRTRADATANSLRGILKRVFAGDRLLLFQQLLDDGGMDEDELVKLRKMIERKRRQKRDD